MTINIIYAEFMIALVILAVKNLYQYIALSGRRLNVQKLK